jgi:hypothetical protein
MILKICKVFQILFLLSLASCADSELASYSSSTTYNFEVEDTASVNLTITTDSNHRWSVKWGNGQETKNISSGASINHTYTSNFTGTVQIITSGNSTIKKFESTSGRWSFDIQYLPESLTHLSVEGDAPLDNIITGNIFNLPTTIKYFKVMGSNTITGDIGILPNGITDFIIDGQNTTLGNTGNLPTTLINYYNDGLNSTTGNILNLPINLQSFANLGQNTNVGNLSALNSSLRHFHVEGLNTITGSISSLPTNLITFNLAGNNTSSGDLIGLPANLTTYVNLGSNTTTGNLGNLPITLTNYTNEGNNTTDGDIGSLPNSLIIYKNTGSNTTSGDISGLHSNLKTYFNSGANTTTAIGTSWGASTTNFKEFYLQGSTSRTQTEIDNILVALTNIISWTSDSSVNLQGAGNASPTGTGQAARTTILANGATSVLVN